jgi:predicted secreted protein
MRRNKKIVVLANCLLNTNVKVYGISTVGGAAPIVTQLIEAGYGIIQLPCIEMAMFGSRRWGRVYEQCDFPSYRKKCRELLIPVVDQIKDLDSNGYEIKCVIGVDGSPTCGVNKTCYGDWGGEIGQSDEIEQSDNHRCRIEEGMVIMDLISRLLL